MCILEWSRLGQFDSKNYGINGQADDIKFQLVDLRSTLEIVNSVSPFHLLVVSANPIHD